MTALSPKIRLLCQIVLAGILMPLSLGAKDASLENFGFNRKIDPQWLPDDSRQWERADESVFITDLSQVQPSWGLHTGWRQRNSWKLLPYETEQLKGVAISTFMDTEPPVVRVDLGRTGWHAVYIGLSTTTGGIGRVTRNGVRVKLTGDKRYRRMGNNLELLEPRRDSIQEQFLDVSNLKEGDEVLIRAMNDYPSTICYVRLVPLNEEEWKGWNRDLSQTRFRSSVYTFDGGGWIWPHKPRTAEDLKEAFRGMETSDAEKWHFQIGADQVYYPSKVGTLRFEGTVDFHKPMRKDHADSLYYLLAHDVNPLQVARDAAREQGREFHIIMRPEAFAAGYPFEEIFASQFYADHPEWRCVDYEGKSIMYMSYAVPEVRQHVVAMFREAVEMVDPEGVGFIFSRGMPMILFEPAFCEQFMAIHHVDPRTLEEEDPRILAVRAQIMTTLLQEIRTMLDEVGAQRGGKFYEIAVSTFSHKKGNLRFGFDVESWVKKGLVNDIVIAVNSHYVRGPRGGIAKPDIEFYKNAVKGTDVGIYPMVVSVATGTKAEHVAKVVDYLRQGADGLSVWDPVVESMAASNRVPINAATRYRGNIFDLMAYMGHRELMEYWHEHEFPDVQSFPLLRLGDNTYSKWYPNAAY